METIKYSLLFILIPSCVYTLAWLDTEHYDKKQWVTDKRSRIFNRLSIFLIIFCFDWYIGLYSLFTFGGMFDIVLNWKRKDVTWDHIGSNYETKHFKWDDLFRKYPIIWKVLEFTQIGVSICMIILKFVFL